MPKRDFSIPVFLIAIVSSGTICARAQTELPVKLKPLVPCPALATAAETNHIPMIVVDRLSDTNFLHAGDSATVLGTLVLKKSEAQWILCVEAAAPDPEEQPEKKPEPMVVNFFGTPISFESKPVPARLRMLGPFAVTNMSGSLKPQLRTAQFSLNESFLGIGLDQAAAVMYHRSQMTNLNKSIGGTNSIPKYTPDEQRALSGSVPALMSYFEIVQHTEGLKDLMMKVVKLPSLWSIVRHVGVTADLSGTEAYPGNPADWSLPTSVPVYYLPCLFRLNGQPALKITFVVTKPHPPLLICGGVIGVLAEKPGDDDTYMTLRVISATHGAGSEKKTK